MQTGSHAGVTGCFYRPSAGAEIDLLLTWPSGAQWAVEIKRSPSPGSFTAKLV